MATDVRRIRVFIASPGDVQQERDALAKVVQEISTTVSAIAPEKRIALELLRWETNARPGLGRPQQLINEQLGDYDLFVGIMWRRFGTPTGVADSGTEEEFDLAYRRWEGQRSFPVLFYFCQEPSPPPRTVAEANQLASVVAFRERLASEGLIWDYASHAGFADVIRPHLIAVLGELLNAKSGVDYAESIGQVALASVAGDVEERILSLAREYDAVRAGTPSSWERTQTLNALATRMKTLATHGYLLLPRLAHGASAGERLAAVAMLTVIPNPEWIAWLADRFGNESAFVEYHSALALLNAARTLGRKDGLKIRRAVELAIAALGEDARSGDRRRVLENALRELDTARPPGETTAPG